MRHRNATKKLGRNSGHRKALMANLARSLFAEERIQTTLPKAKALRSYAEKLITTAKRDTLHARRLVARVVRDGSVLAKVFAQLAPRYAERPGGYTRIYKLGHRRGDSAELAIIEMVDRPVAQSQPTSDKPAGKRKLVQREGETGAGEAAGGA
jgi:large subunit ribosomal protein L17